MDSILRDWAVGYYGVDLDSTVGQDTPSPPFLEGTVIRKARPRYDNPTDLY